jgi:hypothetical protein
MNELYQIGNDQMEESPGKRDGSRAHRFKPGISGNPSGRPKVEGEVRALARRYTTRAIRRLAQLMRSDNPRVAVAAATALLDRAWGKPAQALTGPDGGPLIPAGFGATAIVGVDPAEIYRRMLRDTTQRVTFAQESPQDESQAPIDEGNVNNLIREVAE